MATKKQTIAGHTFTLDEGYAYIATRPMASRRHQKFSVAIRYASDPITSPPIIETTPLSYNDANALIDAFNNGETSWDGRIW